MTMDKYSELDPRVFQMSQLPRRDCTESPRKIFTRVKAIQQNKNYHQEISAENSNSACKRKKANGDGKQSRKLRPCTQCDLMKIIGGAKDVQCGTVKTVTKRKSFSKHRSVVIKRMKRTKCQPTKKNSIRRKSKTTKRSHCKAAGRKTNKNIAKEHRTTKARSQEKSSESNAAKKAQPEEEKESKSEEIKVKRVASKEIKSVITKTEKKSHVSNKVKKVQPKIIKEIKIKTAKLSPRDDNVAVTTMPPAVMCSSDRFISKTPHESVSQTFEPLNSDKLFKLLNPNMSNPRVSDPKRVAIENADNAKIESVMREMMNGK